ALNQAGCPTVEGPALWPAEFCGDALGMPQDMWMHLATVNIHDRGLLVLSSPTEEEDQIHRFYQQRGAAGVHHIALLCEDVEEDAELFFAAGWSKTSTAPARDGDLIQWFLKNKSGQILELISRPSASHKTFTCNNIHSLRAAEG
ncbi:MAG: hypothetical protein D3925_10585, partial [Candidatus Electrothrix sp. AR5]|nr:hypothetical protein [Candidatus Electrothrix sp. AR5]